MSVLLFSLGHIIDKHRAELLDFFRDFLLTKHTQRELAENLPSVNHLTKGRFLFLLVLLSFIDLNFALEYLNY